MNCLNSHEDEDSAVEAVRPAGVGRSRQLVAVEQIVDVGEHERVGVEEHALAVLGQPPAVQLRERHAQLRPISQRTGARQVPPRHRPAFSPSPRSAFEYN